MRALPSGIAISLLVTAHFSEAQLQERVYPFIELTDEMRARIDLRDGLVGDWSDVLGEPTLTPLDFALIEGDSYDPSSFDFRVWLTWHDGGDHLFVAAEFVDDVYENPYERDEAFSMPFGDGAVWFSVDGDMDADGALGNDPEHGGVPADMKEAQLYAAFARTYLNDSNVTLSLMSASAPWVHQVPYADGGGGIIDSHPVCSVLEFYVTPFDRFLWDDPKESVISDLYPGKEITFNLLIVDVDQGQVDGSFGLFGPGVDAERDQLHTDLWARGVLLQSPEDDTSVKSVSWGRIKAGLAE